MNKKMSVFAFYVKNGIFRIVIICLLLIAAEIALFLGGKDQMTVSFGDYLMNIKIHWVFAIGIMLDIFANSGKHSKSFMPKNAVKKLQVTELEAFRLEVLVHALYIVIIAGVQIGLVLGFGKVYTDMSGGVFTELSVSIDFLRNSFFHPLLPMGDVALIIRNIVFIFGMAYGIASCSLIKRSEKKHVFAVVCTIFIIIRFFMTELRTGPISQVILIIIVLIFILILDGQGKTICEEGYKDNETKDSLEEPIDGSTYKGEADLEEKSKDDLEQNNSDVTHPEGL